MNDIPFQKKLVLNNFILKYFGFESFEDIKSHFSDPLYEGINSEGQSRLFQAFWNLMEEVPDLRITKEDFAQYDLNIINHLTEMNKNRGEQVSLKYFQYFSLVFVEAYLDNFFSSRERLVKMLNEQLAEYSSNFSLVFKDYEIKDLNKLAIWNATGSGKTLLMHINVMQMKYYLRKYNIRFDGAYMLLTPSEALSNQHLEEFQESGIIAERFEKTASRLFSRPDDIQVIENSKLAEKDGEKTVSIHRFGDTNILFVDEGHRGSSGESWYQYRSQLCENGFSFEYSATFSQAVRKKKALEEEYAKCILFDYSYKYFYEDGYGKDYQILNLPIVTEDNIRLKYLTASLLSYYQQKRLFLDKGEIFSDYNLENPLMVFVGSKVTASASMNDKSDVVEIVNFFSEFISKTPYIIAIIEQLINGVTELVDSEGRDVFAGKFNYLQLINLSGEEIYDDVLRQVFHTKYRNQIFHADNLKGIDGEIRLRVGENDAFGVINVGSDTDLLKLIEIEGVQTNTVDFSESLFKTINDKDSSINVLIGSKKFSEGWNSWRVSTMGLMNVGQNEGSQIIQLFGRGVRLKGRMKFGNYSLKRSSSFHKDFHFEAKPSHEDMLLLPILETLNIFGIRANYMQQFKAYLTSEGLNPDSVSYKITIPVVRTDYPKKKLKTLRVKNGLDFLKDGPQPEFLQYIPNSIILDTYGKVQFETSVESSAGVAKKEYGALDERHFFGMNFEHIYFELLAYKKQKKYWNIIFTLDQVKKKLHSKEWYTLYIPNSELIVQSFSDFERFNRIGLTLMKKYLDKISSMSRKNFEAPLLEYVELEKDDPNFIDNYEVTVENAEQYPEIRLLLENIQSLVKDGLLNTVESGKKSGVSWRNVQASLFNPLFHVKTDLSDVKIVPSALVESEWAFIDNFGKYIDKNPKYFEGKEVYLIRNASRKGVGFFEDEGFYPDFIMWYFDGEKEYIVFVEPHGMRHENLEDSHKIQFAKKIKELEKSITLTEAS